MTDTQEAAIMESGRVLARAGLSGVVRACTVEGQLPVLVVITPGNSKVAAIGFAHELSPREIVTLDDTQPFDDQSLTE